LATQVGDGIYSVPLSTPIQAVTDAHLLVTVSDLQA